MKRALLLAVAMAMHAGSALAHDTWLRAHRAGQALSLELASGERFGKAEMAAGPDLIERAEVRLRDDIRRLGPPLREERLLRFALPVSGSGVATVWVSLVERVADLNEKQVAHYLDEIGAPGYVRDAWAAAGPARRWRERFAQHAKTFVRVGPPVADRSWSQPAGLPLEIVPESDPTALRAGNPLRVRVLQDGQPLPAIRVACMAPSGKVQAKPLTDRSGRVSCSLNTPGPWLLRAVELRRSRTQGADWESQWAMLTVNVSQRASP